MRAVVWLSVLVLLGEGCAPKRLKDIAQEDKEKTEAQLKSERLLAEAELLFDRGNRLEAQERLMDALRVDPTLYRAHLVLGDIYELEGDRTSTLLEYTAHTECAPKARYYLDRMFAYVFGAYSRHPAGPEQIGPEKKARAALALSEAVAVYRQGKKEAALSGLDEVRRGLPDLGVVAFFEGNILSTTGRASQALEAFANAAHENPYFARRLLTDHADRELPGLVDALASVLERDLKSHPSDSETAFLLAAIAYRRGDFHQAVRMLRQALSWSNPRWDLLMLKAAAHDRLGEGLQTEQALTDISSIPPDLSVAFSTTESSMFQGLLDGKANDFVRTRFAMALEEPIRSYFLWRFFGELEEKDQAEKHRQAFFEQMAANFPADEFKDAPAGTSEAESRGLKEFMGAVQQQIDEKLADFAACDETRRSKRGSPSGRIVVRVELARDGSVAQVGVEENTTADRWLAYCIVRKVVAMAFPKPLRATEMFKVPVLFGPEVKAGKEERGASRQQ